jgi:hypothetical protein
MLSKLSRNLSNRKTGSSRSANTQQMKYGKGILTHRKNNLKTNIPSHRKIRVMGRQRRTLESGVTSKKSLGTTPMNVKQSLVVELKEKS